MTLMDANDGHILFKEESFAIVGACFEVHNQMGCGFTEAIYQECLEIEFAGRGIPFVAQPTLSLFYKETKIGQNFRPDFLCYDRIIVEIKSIEALADAHRSQVLNYLNAGQFPLGILVNFGTYPKVQIERLAKSEISIRDNSRHSRADFQS